MKKRTKKGQLSLGQMLPAVLLFLLIGLVLGVGSIVASQFKDVTSNADAQGVINKTLTGLVVFGDFQTTIATIVAAVVIISLLLVALAVFFTKRGGGGMGF